MQRQSQREFYQRASVIDACLPCILLTVMNRLTKNTLLAVGFASCCCFPRITWQKTAISSISDFGLESINIRKDLVVALVLRFQHARLSAALGFLSLFASSPAVRVNLCAHRNGIHVRRHPGTRLRPEMRRPRPGPAVVEPLLHAVHRRGRGHATVCQCYVLKGNRHSPLVLSSSP